MIIGLKCLFKFILLILEAIGVRGLIKQKALLGRNISRPRDYLEKDSIKEYTERYITRFGML